MAVGHWSDEIDTLRHQLNKLEARVKTLEGKSSNSLEGKDYSLKWKGCKLVKRRYTGVY